MAITLGGGGSASQINEVVTLNNTADTVTLADGRVYLKGGVFETNQSTYPLAFLDMKEVLTFDVSLQDTNALGVTWDGTHYWVVGATNDRVYKYDAAGAYTSTFFSISAQSTSPFDIEWDGTFFWVLDGANNKIWKYNSAGVYQSVFFSVNTQATSGWKGVTWDGTFFWVANSNGNVYKYNSSGVYQSVTFSAASEVTSLQGIAWDGTYFWVADYYQTLYKYNSAGVYQNETITTEYINGVGTKDNAPMVVVQSPRSVDVYGEAIGVVPVINNGGQNYMRVA